ncbi:MAG TPA: M48 family metalloprotease [Candidatus Paceibacterota bacterium]|nr:M48 family metalloprotease [Candidatus Paceibacterota bacterium]
MATIYTHQSDNIAKTWLLVGLFLVIVVAVGYVLAYLFQSPGILTFAIVFAVFMNILSYWYSDKIALSMAKAQPAPENEYPELYRIVENLCITAGLPKPALYIIPDNAPNAFATGRNASHASIAVTSGLLRMMDQNELQGVLAHELSHVGNRDILLSSVIAVLVGFIAIIANVFTRGFWLGGGRGGDREGGNGLVALIGIIFVILSPIIATLIQLAVSRRRESLADASGALLTRYPEGLASALRKIAAYSRPMQTANNATAHMYISNPFGPKAFSGIQKLFMTHPPIEDRIKALEEMSV